MKKAQVTSDGLKMHVECDINSKVLDELSPKDALDVLLDSANGVWTKVWVARSGQSGWVKSRFLDIWEEQATPYVTQDSSSDYGWMLLVAGLIGLVAVMAWGLR